MDSKKPSQRPRKPDTQGARHLVFTLAVSATVGFWAIFSRLDNIGASNAEVPEQLVNEIPLVDDEGQAAFGLPPIPTLVPSLEPANLAPVVMNGLPAPVVIGAELPSPSLSKTPPTGKTSSRWDKDSGGKKAKPGRGGGEKTTKTRSS